MALSPIFFPSLQIQECPRYGKKGKDEGKDTA